MVRMKNLVRCLAKSYEVSEMNWRILVPNHTVFTSCKINGEGVYMWDRKRASIKDYVLFDFKVALWDSFAKAFIRFNNRGLEYKRKY
jgi:hypothetical protein